MLTSCCCDQLTRSSASSHDIRFPCSYSTDSAELGTEPTPATLTLETLVWLFFKTCFRRNIWRLMRNVRSPNSAEKHSRLMSPSCVSCGLGAIWWLLDKFKSRWISCCMLLSLYAEWTTGFYRFSDVWSLSLTRYVNQIRADDVSNWVFSRWNFAACIFTQRTSQNESCLKVKVNMDRIFFKKKQVNMYLFLATTFKTAMRAWRRSEVKVSSCTFTDNLSQIRFNPGASPSGHFISCHRRK